MAGAPPPMQFAPLSFASGGGGMGSQLQQLAKAAGPMAGAMGGMMQPGAMAAGSAVPGAAGPTSVGGANGPMPLVQPGMVAPAQPQPGQIGSMQAGPVAPGQSVSAQPSILDAIKGMQPTQIMDVLRNMSNRGQSVGVPGSAAMNSAGMLAGIGG